MGSPSPIRQITRCTVKPVQQLSGGAAPPTRYELAAWDLVMLSAQYIQKGHFFSIPSSSRNLDDITCRLKHSLSVALAHFYPLAGRFVTETPSDGSKGMSVHINCKEGGAEFVVAVADNLSIRDVLKPLYTPSFVRHFFPMDLAVTYEGHSSPLLAVQVTELADGIFVGCSFNHVVGDGASFWNFMSSWAETCRGVQHISRPPVHERWFVQGTPIPILLPFSSSDEFVDRYVPPESLMERTFHFTSDSIAHLKTRANEELRREETSGATISSFQALSALVWRSITRARRFTEAHTTTNCRLAIDNRSRLRPPLPPTYFGNSVYAVSATATVGELLAHNIGWAAESINHAVVSHTDSAIRGTVEKWMKNPGVYSMRMFDKQSIMMGSSPRFDMYGCNFGWGKAVALRSGSAHKFDGKVSSYPGREGGGSVDLEICLMPDYMRALESDEEFMSVISQPCFD